MFNLFQYHLKISLRYSLYNACKPYHHQNNTYSFERPYTCYAYAELIIRHGLHAQCRIAMNMGPTFPYTYTHTDWFCACWCKVMLPFIHCILLYDDFKYIYLLVMIKRSHQKLPNSHTNMSKKFKWQQQIRGKTIYS